MNHESLELVIKNGTCLISNPADPSQMTRTKTDIGVLGGKIVEIRDGINAPRPTEF